MKSCLEHPAHRLRRDEEDATGTTREVDTVALAVGDEIERGNTGGRMISTDMGRRNESERDGGTENAMTAKASETEAALPLRDGGQRLRAAMAQEIALDRVQGHALRSIRPNPTSRTLVY